MPFRTDSIRIGVVLVVLATIVVAAFIVQQPVVVQAPATPPLHAYEQVAIRGEKTSTQEDPAVSDREQLGVATPLDDSLLITNSHVVDKSLSYSVSTPDGQDLELINFWHHPSKDLALVETVTGTDRNGVRHFSISRQKTHTGDRIVYYTPHGKVTSCKRQQNNKQEGLIPLVDCSFKQGMSGTPVYLPDGSLVGIVTASSPSGGFVTPLTYNELAQWVETIRK